ncbi:hypothetical protein BpHYR1_031856 [Brachionus plicatilis]|uniref:Uncharacterized protein n=1 Tax=Brachionus plicatilis TaxID=10195 RepID=A0A3M7SHA9_BRAPC|nr:hypothetical protein BpHYR1_031856 [Brachionus plicatilis]
MFNIALKGDEKGSINIMKIRNFFPRNKREEIIFSLLLEENITSCFWKVRFSVENILFYILIFYTIDISKFIYFHFISYLEFNI